MKNACHIILTMMIKGLKKITTYIAEIQLMSFVSYESNKVSQKWICLLELVKFRKIHIDLQMVEYNKVLDERGRLTC